MGIQNLPAALQSVIQQAFLERAFEESLRAKLGFRAIADRENFAAGIGETITKTRTGLLPTITTPLSPAANSDITSGLTPQNYSVEQYTLGVAQYGANMMLNIKTSKVAIANLYLRNGVTLGEQAFRSVDALAQMALFNTYMGGNTRVRTTLGAPGTALNVDDIRGFQNTLNAAGQVIPVSTGSAAVNVTVGADVYSCVGAVADGSNVSTTPGGISGVLTFATNVSTSDGTAANAVVSAVAPYVIRPSTTAANAMAATVAAISAANDLNAGKLTMDMILTGKATMSANGVPPVAETGMYHYYADPLQTKGLFSDPAFQLLFRGGANTPEYRRGVVADLLGVQLIETNLNPVQALSGVGTVRRGVLVGQGALVEGVFTNEAYAETEGADDDEMITVVDDIAHVTREPLDALKQVVTQSWSYIGGFAVPSDTTANPNTIPTANNSAFKRGIILESL
jgi:hypothetical protein